MWDGKVPTTTNATAIVVSLLLYTTRGVPGLHQGDDVDELGGEKGWGEDQLECKPKCGHLTCIGFSSYPGAYLLALTAAFASLQDSSVLPWMVQRSSSARCQMLEKRQSKLQFDDREGVKSDADGSNMADQLSTSAFFLSY